MNIHAAYEPFLRYFRPARWRRFLSTFRITPQTAILDVGGYAREWLQLPVRPRVVLLNIQPEPRSSLPQVMADGCCLPYPDKCFDIVFSNSTIEHVADQAAFAREAMRVGKAYWIQTPNKWFPVEPHLLCPFIHWLPRHLQRPLMPITPWGLMVKPNAGCCDAFQDSLHLLDARRLQRLFPGCRLIREMFGGITKSLIAYHE